MITPTPEDLRFIHPALRDKAQPIERFYDQPWNPRLHPEANRKAIRASLLRHGQRQVIFVNETPEGLRIEAHHQVFHEMVALGSKWVAAAIGQDDLATEISYLLADNQTGDLSMNDDEKLWAAIRLLQREGEDVEEMGFPTDKLEDAPEDSGPPILKGTTKLKTVKVKPPPDRIWILAGVPVSQVFELGPMVDRLKAIDGSIVVSMVGSDDKS